MSELTKDEKEKLGKECKCSCGKIGTYCIDPYIEDINNTEVLTCLCGNCYQEACDDI